MAIGFFVNNKIKMTTVKGVTERNHMRLAVFVRCGQASDGVGKNETLDRW
jgi:hypothetical protein